MIKSGHFAPAQGGQFAPASGGQFKPARGGQFDRFFHPCGIRNSKSLSSDFKIFITPFFP